MVAALVVVSEMSETHRQRSPRGPAESCPSSTLGPLAIDADTRCYFPRLTAARITQSISGIPRYYRIARGRRRANDGAGVWA